jgi:hypothetical protein
MRHIYPLIVAASLSLCPAIVLASTPVTTGAAADAPVRLATSTPATAKHAPTGAKATDDDRNRYAARDEASPRAKDYRGGDTVVIGTTALVAILAVVLLVVLL